MPARKTRALSRYETDVQSVSQVRSPKLSHLVAERIRAQIADGELAVGDNLPSEADLITRFGVSRPTLREGLRILESEALIRLGRGARTGATVLRPSVAAVTRSGALYLAVAGTTLGEIHQVRALLEPAFIADLARRPNPKLFKALEQCVEGLRRADKADDPAAFAAHANEFHALLGKHSGNRAIALLSEMLRGLAGNVYAQMVPAGGTASWKRLAKERKSALAAYERLLRLIANGKAKEAERLFRRHMARFAQAFAKDSRGNTRVRLPLSQLA